MASTRRLTAILAADVAGYSRLKLNRPPTRARAREGAGYSLNSGAFRRARNPQGCLTECSHTVYRLHTKKRPSRSKNVYIAEPAPELQPMCCEIGAPRREIGVDVDPRDPP